MDPRSGSADELRKLAPVLGLDVGDLDVADARYRAGHMKNPLRTKELEMGAAR